MHPILIELGPVTIHTYGLFVALGFLAAMAWTWLEVRKAGLDEELIPDFALLGLLGGLVGARLMYVALNLDFFLDHPERIVMFWKGGMVFSGGAILGAALPIWLARRKGAPVLKWLDCVAPAAGLGQAIGRIGCFSAGCCYGAPTHSSLGVTFTDTACLAKPLGVPLHPTQLYHAAAGLACFGLIVLSRRWLKRPGQQIGLYLVLFPVFRFIIEFFRADHRGEFGPLSATQAVAVAFFALGCYLIFRNPKRSNRELS